jgi:hypothetical protein
MTSELSRNLYHSSITLEEKHKALLARLPSTTSSTPRSTPTSSAAPTPEYKTTPLPYLRSSRARRISLSPSDLTLLADQNTELLLKVEKLESESAQANLVGRRRLEKLEKEIDVLREELDQHRSQSDALQLEVESKGEEARKRKQEWNDRVRAHRSNNSRNPWSLGGEGGVRNFAPSGNRPVLPSAILKPILPTAPDTVSPSQLDSDPPAPETTTTPLSPSQHARAISTVSPPGESVLVAQLVSKVHELEMANEQILESQRDTATKLQEAQKEAEGIRRLYAFLDEQPDVELEVVEDDVCESLPVHDRNHTMRFRSLRRSIHGDLGQFLAPSLGKGTEPGMEGAINSKGHMNEAPLKARKTVLGLFDTPSQLARDGSEPAMMINNSPSPALSCIDLPGGSLFSSSHAGSQRATLKSELGSDYGGDYAENHHLRESSLYNVFLSGPTPSRPTTPASQVCDAPSSSIPFPDGPQSKPTDDADKTPRNALFKIPHQHRLSDTIRSRTNYWVTKRFHYTTPVKRHNRLQTAEVDSSKDPVVVSRPAVAQVAVQTTHSGTKEEDLALVRVATRHPLHRTAEDSKPKRSRAMTVVVELWLWVQFMIIIMVFLWAVTKRGPRSVLRNAERVTKRVE